MDFNKVKAVSLDYLQKGVTLAVDVTEKSKVEVLVLNNKAKLYRAQRQLGALVYSLAKGHEENQPLVDKYIAIIAAIEQEIDRLKASLTPAEKEAVEQAEAEVDAEVVATEEVATEEVAEETAAEPVAAAEEVTAEPVAVVEEVAEVTEVAAEPETLVAQEEEKPQVPIV